MNSFVASLLVLTGFLAYTLGIWLKGQSRRPLPPGPAGYPIIGNVFGVAHHHLWFMYADWAKSYESDVLSYKTYGRTTVVLNSYKAVTELLEKRSYNYSDRPRQIMVDELMGWHWDFAHMRYGDWWRHEPLPTRILKDVSDIQPRRHRRAFHQYFQSRNLPSYYPIQIKMTLRLLEQLGATPDGFKEHIRQMVSSIVLHAAYGYEAQAENDYYVKLVDRAIPPLLEGIHKAFIVDYVPLLKHIPAWFPGAGFKRKAAASYKNAAAVPELPFRKVKDQMADGTAQPSFVSNSLLHMMAGRASVSADEEEIIKNCAGLMYLAGSDTTAALLLAWQLAMLHNPDVQKRAQTEIDKVCGQSRLPEFGDRPLLPYVEATMLETMRWHAIAPLSLPHRCINEDEYDGYRIPAGATVTPNAWAILHDPELYPEPFKFSPERFLDEGQEKVTFKNQPDPSLSGGFGYGRRICPGRYLAMSTGWIAIANILATYNLSKAIDAQGRIIEPQIRFKDGLISHPEPYEIQYKVRSKNIHSWIETAKFAT